MRPQPGLVCGHHHLYSALARGMPAPPKQPTNFIEILEQVWWRLDVALDEEMIRWSAMLGATEALMCGTTGIIDHHESPSAIDGSLSIIADACAEVGVRVNCAYGVTDRHGSQQAAQGLAENERYLRAGGRGMVGLHAAFTCRDETLAAAAQLAADLGVGVHVHVAEGVADRDAGARLESLAADDWLLVHCVHLDRPLPGTIAHNPRSNMNNSVGYAAPTSRSNPIVLGTDGIGADMLEEARLAYMRLREHDVAAGQTWCGRGWRRGIGSSPNAATIASSSTTTMPTARGTSRSPPVCEHSRSRWVRAKWSCATGVRRASMSTRCAPKLPSRPLGCSQSCRSIVKGSP